MAQKLKIGFRSRCERSVQVQTSHRAATAVRTDESHPYGGTTEVLLDPTRENFGEGISKRFMAYHLCNGGSSNSHFRLATTVTSDKKS
eukprot:5215190-Amphidinium_carterae.1